jgi:hypothetical protein
MGVHLSEVVPAIIHHRTRWEHLEPYLSTSFPAIKGPLPLLQSLQLYITRSGTFELPDAPQLREAVLNKRGSSTAVTLLWMQLTSLTLSEVEPSWYFSILQQTPKLVHCNLDVWIADDEIIDQTGPDIRLPCLE